MTACSREGLDRAPVKLATRWNGMRARSKVTTSAIAANRMPTKSLRNFGFPRVLAILEGRQVVNIVKWCERFVNSC